MIHRRRIACAVILFGLGTCFIEPLETPAPTSGAIQQTRDKPPARSAAPMDFQALVNQVLVNAEDLRRKGRHAEAIAAYNDLLGQSGLSPELANSVRVARIAATTELNLAKKSESPPSVASPPGMTPADPAATKLIETAKQLRQKGNFTEALAALSEAITLPNVSPAILVEAREEKAATMLGKANADHPGIWRSSLKTVTDFWSTSTKSFVTLMLWMLVLGIVFMIVWIFRRLVPPKTGMLIDVQDLSATDKSNGSRLLSSEINQTLSPPVESSVDEYESMKDFEGAGAASIRPMVKLPGLEEPLLQNGNPIAIGPLQFTPATLMALLRRLFERRYEQTLSGVLVSQNDQTVVIAHLKSNPYWRLPFGKKRAKPLPASSWHVAQEGKDARPCVLRKIAARVMILQARENLVTANAASLEAVLEGIDRLCASTGRNRTPEKLRETVECFQTALSHDPGNWVARFNLSVLARQLGDNEFAIQNCEMLEEMICPKAQDDDAAQNSKTEEKAFLSEAPVSPEAQADEAATQKSETEASALQPTPAPSPEAHDGEAATQKVHMEENAPLPKPSASFEAHDDEAANKNSKTMGKVTPPPRSPSLNAHVANNPSFLDSVRYNRALALSKIPKWEANKQAVALLDALIKTDGALTPLAMSAKAAALLFQVTQLRAILEEAKLQSKKAKEQRERQHDEAKPQAEMVRAEAEMEVTPQAEMEKAGTGEEHKEVKSQPETNRAETEKKPAAARRQAELEKVENEILKICEDLEALTKKGELTRGLVLAHAVALNAKGFMLEENDRAKARKALAAAAASQPNFVEPHINLARLYRHGQQKVAHDWVVRAQGHLAQALALQPDNRDAHYEMGRLLSSEAMLRYADALDAFGKAAPHSDAAYWAAEIYFDSNFAEANLAKGIEQLRTSIRLSPKTDRRLGVLADHWLDAAEQQRNSAITALALATSALNPPRVPGSPLPAEVQKLCDRARELLDEADRAVRRLARSQNDQLKRWAERDAARTNEIRKGFPT